MRHSLTNLHNTNNHGLDGMSAVDLDSLTSDSDFHEGETLNDDLRKLARKSGVKTVGIIGLILDDELGPHERVQNTVKIVGYTDTALTE